MTLGWLSLNAFVIASSVGFWLPPAIACQKFTVTWWESVGSCAAPACWPPPPEPPPHAARPSVAASASAAIGGSVVMNAPAASSSGRVESVKLNAASPTCRGRTRSVDVTISGHRNAFHPSMNCSRAMVASAGRASGAAIDHR